MTDGKWFARDSKRSLRALKLGALVAMVTPWSVAMAQTTVQQLEQRVSEQQTQLQLLQGQIHELKKEQVSESANVSKVVRREKAHKPGYWRIPGTHTDLKIGGWVTGKSITDVNARTGNDFLSYSDIPLEGSTPRAKDWHTNLDARDSRLRAQTFTAFHNGVKVVTFLSMGFFGGGPGEKSGAEQQTANGFSPRLRQGWGKLIWGKNSLLIGQAWSTFMDPAFLYLTDRIEFASPPGTGGFVRQPMFRYSRKLAGGSELSLAVENPETDVNGDAPTGHSVSENDQMPDITARYTMSGSWGHGYVSGVVRQLNIDDGNGLHESTLGWGLSAGLKYPLANNDTLMVQATGGKGVGRYLKEMGGQAGTFEAAPGATTQNPGGKLKATGAWGATLTYVHHWTPKWRSTIWGGFASANNPHAANYGSLNKRVWSGAVNLFYRPVRNVDLGVEYVYAKRTTENGEHGDLSRIEVGGRYFFNFF